MSQNNIGIDLNLQTRMARDKSSGLSSSFVQLSKDGKAADRSIVGLTGSLSTMTKVISGVGLYKLTKALGQAMSAAADIRESVHMYNVAMGDFAESTALAVDELSDLSGLDRIKLLDTVGEFNLLARSMGVTSDNSAVLSENVNRLSLDLASLTNRDIQKVQEDLKSGLLGRSRTVYKYGIDITEAALAQEALNQGISKSVRHMSQAEKMQLRYQIMIKATGLAHGDFANTIETPANQMRILSDRILTATRSLGTIFIPMLTKVMPYLNAFAKALNTVFMALARLVGYDPKVNEGIKNTGDAFGDATGDLEDGMDDAGKSAKDTEKKVERLKKKVQQLAGFDELNILGKHETPTQPTKPKKDKDGDGRGGALDFNLEGYDSQIDGIAQKTDEIFDKMVKWMEKVQEAAKPTTAALKRLWNEGLKDLRGFSSQALKDFYHNFLVPVGRWTLGDQGLARFLNIVNAMLREINWKRLNNHLADLFTALTPFAIAVGTGLIDFFEQVYAPFVVWTFNDAVPRILEAITNALNNIDWDLINLKLKEFFGYLGITNIEVHEVLLSFFERVLVPIAEWTVGTGFPKLLDILSVGLANIKWKKIHKSFNNLFDSIAPFGERIGEGLLWMLEKVLVPLAGWTISNVLPWFLDVLAIALDTIGTVIDIVAPVFRVLWDVLIEPLATLIGMGLKAFGGVLKFFTPALTTFLLAWGVIKTLGLIGNMMAFTSEVGLFAVEAGKLTGVLGGPVNGMVDTFGATLMVAGDAAKGMGAKFKQVVGVLFSPTGAWIIGIGAGLLALKKLNDYMKKDAIGDVELYGEGVSAATEKAVSSYMELETKATNSMNYIKFSGSEITQKMSEELVGLYGQMSESIVGELEEQKRQSMEIFDSINTETLAKYGFTEEQVMEILSGSYDDRIQLAQNREERINEIIRLARENDGVFQEGHREELYEIQEAMKEEAIDVLSRSEEEQMLIRNRIKTEGTKITTKGASEILQRSIKNTDDTIEEAERQYEGKMVHAANLRKEGSAESIALADVIEKEAEREREAAVTEAETMHEDVVREIKEMGEEVTTNLDLDSGKILTGWEKFKKNFLEDMGKLLADPIKYFKELGKTAWDEIKKFDEKYGPNFNEFVDGMGEATWEMSKTGGGHITDFAKKGYTWLGKLQTKGTKSMEDLEKNNTEDVKKLGKNLIKWLNKGSSEGIDELDELNIKGSKALDSLDKDGSNSIKDMKEDILRKFGTINEDGSWNANQLQKSSLLDFGIMETGIGTSMGSTVRTVGSKFKDMLTDSDTTVGSIVTGVSNMPGKMADGIKKGADNVKSAFVNLWKAVVKGIRSPVNKVLGGANWILGKFNAPKIDLWPAQYAAGTDGHPGGHAIVNDQKGSTYREAVQFPGREPFVPKGRNVLIPNMPVGTKVMPAKQTEKLKMYAGGVGDWAKSMWTGVKTKAQFGWDKLKDVGAKFWDFASKPGKLVKEVLAQTVNYEGLGGMAKDMGKGMVSRVTDSMVDWASNLFSQHEDPSISSSAGYGGIGFPAPPFSKSSSYGYRMHPTLGKSKFHSGIDLSAPSGTPIHSQMSGKVTNAGWAGGYGKMVKIAQGRAEQIYAHMSKIMTSKGKQVGSGERIGNVGSTGRSTGPHLHFEKRMNGKSVNPGNPLVSRSQYEKSKQANKDKNKLNFPPGDKVNRWSSTVRKALRMNNLPDDSLYTSAWLRQIRTESGGNPNAIQGSGVKDVNYYSGNLARGLVQVIPPTFNSYKHKGYNNIMNPLDNLLAGMNYAKKRYGKKGMLNAIGKGRGYAKGGFISGMTSFNVAGESGHEGVVPLEGRHMMPFADAIAERLGEYTQTAINKNNSTNSNNNNTGGVVVQIGERTIVDIIGSEINRKSKINGKSVIRV